MRPVLPACLPLILLLSAARLQAQDAASQTANPLAHAPDGGTYERITSILIPTTPNVPFTARVSLEWERFAADGSRLHTGNARTVARDHEGRVFQERRFIVTYAEAAHSPVSQVEYEDPIEKTQYICRPQQKVCELQPFRPIPPITVPGKPIGNAGNGNAPSEASSAESWEGLGTQSIEGFVVEGTRETITLAPGMIGNDQPTTGSREYWYSRELGMNLLTIRKDPTTGTQTFRVSDISRQEPDPSTFRPPSDFKVIDTRSDPTTNQPLQ